MSELNMMPVPIVQMGLVEKLVEVEQNQPHVQQLVAQESAKQAMKAEAERVPRWTLPSTAKKFATAIQARKRKSGARPRTGLPTESMKRERIRKTALPKSKRPRPTPGLEKSSI